MAKAPQCKFGRLKRPIGRRVCKKRRGPMLGKVRRAKGVYVSPPHEPWDKEVKWHHAVNMEGPRYRRRRRRR